MVCRRGLIDAYEQIFSNIVTAQAQSDKGTETQRFFVFEKDSIKI